VHLRKRYLVGSDAQMQEGLAEVSHKIQGWCHWDPWHRPTAVRELALLVAWSVEMHPGWQLVRSNAHQMMCMKQS